VQVELGSHAWSKRRIACPAWTVTIRGKDNLDDIYIVCLLVLHWFTSHSINR